MAERGDAAAGDAGAGDAVKDAAILILLVFGVMFASSLGIMGALMIAVWVADALGVAVPA